MGKIAKLTNKRDLYTWFDESGLKDACKENKRAYVKISLPKPPEPLNKRTNVKLIKAVADYLNKQKAECVIVESADGFLGKNLRIIGLGDYLDSKKITFIDLDTVEAKKIGKHHLPNCLFDSDIRIALPNASQKPGLIYSNAVKLHFGTLPKRYYGIKGRSEGRALLHLNLQESVAEVFEAIQKNIKFDWHITAGPYVAGEKVIEGPWFASKDAISLDYELAKFMGVEPPKYLSLLREHKLKKEKL